MTRPNGRTVLGTAWGAVLAAVVVLAGSGAAQTLSGFDLYRSRCDGCHELYDPEDPKRTRQQWETILNRMIKVRGAVADAKEAAAILGYLDSFNRPRREIQWLDGPAPSRKAALSPADSGKLPAEWVDLTLGGDEPVPWAIQADPARRLAYLSPLKSAAENQFPALIDNTGLVKNGTITTRLQLVSGTGAVGAGILFGYRNTQSYFGVRLSQRDAVLYEVKAGQRALLARAPLTTPIGRWTDLSVSVQEGAVRVSVNGKPAPALDRTLAGYQPGRVGIHTQGNTVALFDQWELTVR